MRRSLLLQISTVLFVCIVGGLAHAAGGEHESDDGALLKETLFQALNLALLLGVLIYFGRKPIAEFFSTRREGIATELSESANLLRLAEQRNSELQLRLADLNLEVDGIREDAGRRAEAEAERILTEARASAERIRRDAQSAVAQELRRAQLALREEAADLAMEIAAQKLAEEVVEADRDRLVDEFITRIEPNTGEGTSR